MAAALKQGAELGMGVDHPCYQSALEPVPDPLRAALLRDLQE